MEEGSLKELSALRYAHALTAINHAKNLKESDMLGLALNRSYYAAFHAMRAVNALDGFDSSKHSGVISNFNHFHVANGEFPKDIANVIVKIEKLRGSSDYDDFFIPDIESVEFALSNSERIVKLIGEYLKTKDVAVFGFDEKLEVEGKPKESTTK